MPRPILECPPIFWHAVSLRFYLKNRSLSSPSPWTGSRNAYGSLAALWQCEVTIPPKVRQEWQAFEAFIARLDGQIGFMRIGNPAKTQPYLNTKIMQAQQPWSDDTLFTDGTGWVDGGIPPTASAGAAAARGENSVVIHGLPAGLSPALYAGDVFEIRPNGQAAEHGHFYMVVSAAPTDEDGQTRAFIRPRLRAGISAGDQVVFDRPMSVFQMVDDEQGGIEHMLPDLGTTGFTAIEVVP